MKVIIKDKLLWEKDTSTRSNIIGCIFGDKIANVNGYVYVERLIKEYPDGTVLHLTDDLKIAEEEK